MRLGQVGFCAGSADFTGTETAHPLDHAGRGGSLLAALPKHLAEIARFSLATRLPKGNVIGPERSQVDLERRGGSSCYEMVLHYAQLSARHLADYAENLCRTHA